MKKKISDILDLPIKICVILVLLFVIGYGADWLFNANPESFEFRDIHFRSILNFICSVGAIVCWFIGLVLAEIGLLFDN